MPHRSPAYLYAASTSNQIYVSNGFDSVILRESSNFVRWAGPRKVTDVGPKQTEPIGRPMTLTQSLEPLRLRHVFGTFPTGVAALAALVGGEPQGIAVSSFTSVSLDPAMVLVCVAKTSSTWPLLAKVPRLGISVLAADQGRACRQLSARTGDRFSGLDWRATQHGAVLLEGASGWLDCSIEHQDRAGDHDIIVLRVHDLDGDHAVPPLVFHGSRLRQLGPEATHNTSGG
jgi:flavin reductase (DIM6/NTAB) family NADH-FMN oxidoreductase RutF